MFDETQRRTPRLNGALRESGRLTVTSAPGVEHRATITYGEGEAAPYALAVHEHLSAHSPPSWVLHELQSGPVTFYEPGTGPKYVEGPLREAADQFLAAVAARVRAEIVK